MRISKEEEERQSRAQKQVEEGELLVATHTLEVELDDAETAARNKQRRFDACVITCVFIPNSNIPL